MKIKLFCWWFGCETKNSPDCFRCNEDLYNGDFIQSGFYYTKLLPFWHRFKYLFVSQKCDVCGKKLSFKRKYNPHENCCSDECFDKWLPF